MPLFMRRNNVRQKPRKQSLGSKLKRLFNKPHTQDLGDLEPHVFVNRFRIMFLRSMIILVIGCAWWVAAPAIFLSLLPGFFIYRQWLTNAHYTIATVYQFWQVVPEILLFGFATVWTSGVVDMLVGNEVLEKVF